MDILFPHDTIRASQSELINDIHTVLKEKKNLLAHAPTGLGKTAAVLSVALPFAMEHGLTVFFLTNRHTQHQIALDTVRAIKKKHGKNIVVADIIGKKWMCLQQVAELYDSEFTEYCKALRETSKCEFFSKLYKKNSPDLSVDAHKALMDSQHYEPLSVEQTKALGVQHALCPYYLTTEKAKNAHLVIADYHNVFYPTVQMNFFARIGKSMDKSIIVVDEAHNLADRIRNIMSKKLTGFMIKQAVMEAKKTGYSNLIPALQHVQQVLLGLRGNVYEKAVSRQEFVRSIDFQVSYDKICDEFEAAGEIIRQKNKRSFVASVGEFLRSWDDDGSGFLRYVTETNEQATLHYSCLDPELLSAPVFTEAYSSIIMSGTLLPTQLYRDILGVPRAVEKVYTNPFPPNHRCALVAPEVTTRYESRTEAMYKQIAASCTKMIDQVPGNCALFFPSYDLRDTICRFMTTTKQQLHEKSTWTAPEKTKFIADLKTRKNVAVCGVAAANLSEGVDLPGFFQMVIIVGLPLARPDLKTKALIDYYEQKFKAGWDYGYTYPAMTKCLQAAGRCIRSETDKGVIVFLDTRFILPRYYQCIPQDWNVKVTKDSVARIKEFFGNPF